MNLLSKAKRVAAFAALFLTFSTVHCFDSARRQCFQIRPLLHISGGEYLSRS